MPHARVACLAASIQRWSLVQGLVDLFCSSHSRNYEHHWPSRGQESGRMGRSSWRTQRNSLLICGATVP